VLVAGGVLGWGWVHDRAERRAALLLASEGRLDDAAPRLRRLLERHPGDVQVVGALALSSMDAGRLVDAQTYLDRWCELRPDEAEPFRQRLELWKKEWKVPEGLGDAERVLRLEPDDARTRQTLSHLYLTTGRPDDAEREALRCYRARPEDPDVWYLLASIYHDQGRAADATSLTDRLLRARPDFVDGLRLRAQLYLDAGQPEPAVDLLRRAAGGPDGDGAAHYELSLALERAGRGKEAKEVLAGLREREAWTLWEEDKHRDDNPGLQARVVETLLAAGKVGDAVRFLTELLARNPHAAGAHELLAECYDRQGQPERAAEQRRLAGLTP
jgi:predicted Zn-dependent protease